MEWMMSILTFAAGLLVRLLVPLALTAFLVWLLGRLDEKWQAGRPASQAATLARNSGCWIAKECSPEQQARCDARAHPEMPCWQYFRQPDGTLQERCLACKIFREAPLPAHI
jgi:hypothetical protein